MNGKSYTVVGGDLRSVKLAELIRDDGNRVNVFGFQKAGFDLHIEESIDLTVAIDESDVVIGPLPCSNDNETLNAPFHEAKIPINEVFKKMSKNQLFLAGRISERVAHLAQVYNVFTVDLLMREEMAVCNAIPTAEGAIQLAMEEMPITLHGCRALILGYGRIGKILSKMLSGLGAHVAVEARKYSDLAWIEAFGYHPVRLDSLCDELPSADVIFNTVPSMILDHRALSLIGKECLIIDLASKPGGVDFETARDQGLKTIWALSLPGKVAPVTAARYMKDTIYHIVSELGV